MNSLRALSVMLAAVAFGAAAMVSQTLLLRRFLWRFEAAETGVALFFASWLLWSGLGAACASSRAGHRLAAALSRAPWLLVLASGSLYFVQYALIGNLRAWLGVAEYQTFPLLHLAAGCLLANAPFCFVAGWVVPSLCAGLERLSVPVSRAFAWEALGAALGGVGLMAALMAGAVPDPRDVREWFRYFPQADGRPGRFETGGGTTFYGRHGGTFFALSSGGVSEVIPEGDRSVELAVLLLSQRPYAKSALLLGQVPLAVALALEHLRPDLQVTWCPCDAEYGPRLLSAVNLPTAVRAAGASAQRYLEQQPDGAFDAVLVLPPSGCSLGGAAWRCETFLREVRRVTSRTGVVLNGLASEAVVLTAEKAALLDAVVSALRRVWPESGCFAAGAGGWWIAAQVPRLAYGADDAPGRFALLKREAFFPQQAVAGLYDAGRAARLAQQCPALNPAHDVWVPVEREAESFLALALADAVREAYPGVAPSSWFPQALREEGLRLSALLLVALWMLPVALGARATAPRRLLAVWLAACGALGLAALLAVLYRLQMRFGALYLMAGAGSCLYLGGLFMGNRLGEQVAGRLRTRPLLLRCGTMLVGVALAGVGLAVLEGAGRVATVYGVVGLCFAVGCAAGTAVPFALAASEGEDATKAAAVFVFADALGAAVAGLSVAALVPLAGVWGAVVCFALLACGVGGCVAVSGPHARLAAGLALIVSLALAGGTLRGFGPELARVGRAVDEALPGASGASESERPLDLRRPSGVPRRIDEERVREMMRRGALSTNSATFWK